MDNYSGGEGERGRSSNLVSGLTTENTLKQPAGMGGMMLVSSTSPGKQQQRCRSVSEMEVDGYRSGGVGGPTKIARTDGYAPFVCREQKMQQIQMGSASASASASDHDHVLVQRNRSGSDNSSACLVSEGRPRLAPSSTNSYASSERTNTTIFNNDGSSNTVSSESRIVLRSNDSVLLASSTDATRPSSLRFYKPPTGMPVSSMATGTREIGGMGMGMGLGLHGVRTGDVRPPFSPAQWQELEHQALIFKYMMACIPVPPELIIPIRKSLLTLPQRSPPLPHHHIPAFTPWSPFHMGFGGNIDPEPGRCRRTDGKKWRCSRDVVPDQKYCERHMHRGRHRSRKHVEGHTAAVTCQSNSTSATATATAPSAVTSSLNNVLPRPASISVNCSLQKLHQPAPLLGTKNLSSQIQQYPLQSAAGAVAASSPSSKDFRYVNGMKGGEMDEHILFSESSNSSTMNNQWRFMAASKAAVPHSPLSKTNSNDSLLQYSSSPQLRTLPGQNLGIIMTEGSQVASIHMNPHDKQHQQRQQHSFLSTDYGRVQEAAMREPEEQPLRHFFDEWPRSRSRNPWATDVEDETSNRSSSTTQLSISIPLPSSNSTPRGKLSLTSLKLSMSGDGSDPLGVDPIEMGLAVGMNMNVEDPHRQTGHSHQQHHHHQANWVPITWGNPMEIGGPLAEVLQSSTTPCGCNNNKPGLNLMNDIGWKDNINNSSSSNKNSTSSRSRDSPPSCMQASSPTERGVTAARMGSAIDHPVPPHKGVGH